MSTRDPHQRAAVATWAVEPVLDGGVTADALISIVPPGADAAFRPSDALIARHFGGRVLRLSFVDGAPSDWDGRPGPTGADLSAILAFARSVAAQPGARLAVHCTAGASRSTAAALTIHADRLGPGREAEMVERLVVGSFDGRLGRCDYLLSPNPLMVALAGRHTGCGLALHQAVLARLDSYAAWCATWESRMDGRARFDAMMAKAAAG